MANELTTKVWNAAVSYVESGRTYHDWPADIVTVCQQHKAMVKAMHDLAQWKEGPVVTGAFDEPGAAAFARQTLSTIAGHEVTGPEE